MGWRYCNWISPLAERVASDLFCGNRHHEAAVLTPMLGPPLLKKQLSVNLAPSHHSCANGSDWWQSLIVLDALEKTSSQPRRSSVVMLSAHYFYLVVPINCRSLCRALAQRLPWRLENDSYIFSRNRFLSGAFLCAAARSVHSRIERKRKFHLGNLGD